MNRESLAYFVLTNLFIFFANATAKVPAIIVFGDSTVDAGNNNNIVTIVKSNFKPYGRDFEGGKPTGRFCNGRLVTDFLSEAFGIKPIIPAYLDPAYGIKDFATGVTFASAGTGYDNLTSHTVSVIPMWKEMEYFRDYKQKLTKFLGSKKANENLREAMYLISAGTNDFIENYYLQPGQQVRFTVEEFINYLLEISENFVTELYRQGARKIVLVGLPPIGCLPLVRTLSGGTCRAHGNTLARNYDDKLKLVVAKLNKKLNGIKLVFADVLNPALQVIYNPQSYGFENVGIGCCGTGTIELSYLCHEESPFTCVDANKYVFWDAVHPTERLYHIVADHLMRTTLAQFQ